MSLDVYLEVNGEEVFERNITHNMVPMAKVAGIYQACWSPKEIGVSKASQLVPLLLEGVRQLLSNPKKFEPHNPPNGWGDYDALVQFTVAYCIACASNPEATVKVSR